MPEHPALGKLRYHEFENSLDCDRDPDANKNKNTKPFIIPEFTRASVSYVIQLFLIFTLLVVFTCVHYYSAHGGQQRESDPLEPELEAAVSCLIGAGSRTWVLWRKQ